MSGHHRSCCWRGPRDGGGSGDAYQTSRCAAAARLDADRQGQSAKFSGAARYRGADHPGRQRRRWSWPNAADVCTERWVGAGRTVEQLIPDQIDSDFADIVAERHYG